MLNNKTITTVNEFSILNAAIKDFLKVAEITGIHLLSDDITIDYSHPKQLPKGKMAVYIFFHGEKCLKVGKVGTNSNARYSSQHYYPNSSRSNLAKSILKNKDNMNIDVDKDNVGEWIKNNTERYNIIIDSNIGMRCLTLLETFIQCRLNPEFEGFESQR